ncbi:hypothetical protein CYY_003144 [Polysphondylium violaceum]|uniref:Transmembrane protein n=1 Tax=Polysphondylium violaceum TaxID=133409 RepID=A0A8J4PV85_9MYCE|nr:hypothetical protein CYY_003144 [Polysphondylium violaceum]
MKPSTPIKGGSTFVQQSPSRMTKSTTSNSSSSFDTMFSFSYNTRVAFSLIPSLIIIVCLGGRLTLYTAAFSILVTYLLDFLNYSELTIGSIWIGLLMVDVSVMIFGIELVSHSLVNAILLFNLAMVLALTGIWATLQFKWVTNSFPRLATSMERILMANIIYPTSVLFTWAIIVFQGLENSAFYLLFILCIQYYLFALPLRSFKVRSSKETMTSTNDFILTRLDSGVITLTILFFPCLFYFATYHRVIFNDTLHLVNIAFLVSLSSVFLFICSKYGSLWWVLPSYWNFKLKQTGQQQHSNNNQFNIIFKIGTVAKVLSMVLLVGCIEYRVLFYSETFYTALRHLSPTWSIFIVTMVLYSLAAMVYYIFIGFESTIHRVDNQQELFLDSMIQTLSLRAKIVFHLLSIFFSAGVSVILDFPFYMFILVSLACLSFTFYLFGSKNQYRDISFWVFSLTSTAVLAWYLYYNFWFIEYQFSSIFSFGSDIDIDGNTRLISLNAICYCIMALFVVSLVPIKFIKLLSGILIVQSILFTLIEIALYSEDMYPSHLMLISSALLIYIHSRLLANDYISKGSSIVLYSLNIGKIVSLFFPPISANYLGTFTIILVFYAMLNVRNTNINNNNKVSLLLVIMCGLVSLLFYRGVSLEIIRAILNYVQSSTGNIPSTLLFSSFLLLFGFLLLPLSVNSNNPPFIKLLMVLSLSISLLLPFISKTNSIDNEITSTTTMSTSKAIKSIFKSNWILLVLFIFIVIISYSRTYLSKSKKLKFLLSSTIGLLMGVYIASNYLIISPTTDKRFYGAGETPFWDVVIYLYSIALFGGSSLFFFYAQWPSNSSPNNMTWFYYCLNAIFPIMYYVSDFKYSVYRSSPIVNTLLYSCRLSILSLWIGFNILISIYLKYQIKTRILGQQQQPKHQFNYISPVKQPQAQQYRSTSSSTNTGVNSNFIGSKRPLKSFNGGIHQWTLFVCNISCILAYILCVYVNWFWINGSELGVLVLSPILLLLTPSSKGIFKILIESHRYFPMIISVSLFLILMSLSKLFMTTSLSSSTVPHYFKSESILFTNSMQFIGTYWIVKNWLLFAFTIPSLFFVIQYLWKLEKQQNNKQTIYPILSLVALIFSDCRSVSLLGALGFISPIIQFSISNMIQKKGNQVL